MSLPTRALAFASRWFEEATVRATFEPLIADWQREWQDAPAHQRLRVTLHGCSAFACAAAVSSPAILRTPVPTNVSNRVVTRIGAFVGVASCLSLIPALTASRWYGPPRLSFALLMPSAITAVFPFAMALAVDAIRRHDAMPPAVERAAVLKLALGALAFMCFFGGWVMPAANQAWRVQTLRSEVPQSTYSRAMRTRGLRESPARGVRELTTSELVFDPSLATEHEAFSGGADRATRVRRELNKRAVLIVLPILLLWLRWRAIDLPRRGWGRPLPVLLATGITFVAFFSLHGAGWWLEREWSLAAGIGYWFSIAIFAVWGVTAPYCRRQLIALA